MLITTTCYLCDNETIFGLSECYFWTWKMDYVWLFVMMMPFMATLINVLCFVFVFFVFRSEDGYSDRRQSWGCCSDFGCRYYCSLPVGFCIIKKTYCIQLKTLMAMYRNSKINANALELSNLYYIVKDPLLYLNIKHRTSI